MPFLNIDDVLTYLNTIPNFQTQGNSGYHPGLEKINRFCESIGNPQNQFKSIHVAGTNGKGTTCSMLTAILMSAGYFVGTYTSPHILVLNERVKINGQNCPDSALVQFFNTFESFIRASELTYFEILTAFGFWFFAQQNIDIAIIEVGLGGRLDATNIISPLCCAITSISLDHQAILGNSIKEIATEKAGIIKTSIPVVLGDLPHEATESISNLAHLTKAPLLKTSLVGYQSLSPETFTCDFYPDATFQLDMPGLINIKNALLCLQILDVIKPEFPISEDAVRKGLFEIKNLSGFKARFEKIHPHLAWYFDGAHNEEAVYWLKHILKNNHTLENCVCICTFMKDKDYAKLLSEYSSFKSVYYYDLNLSRSASYSDISKIAPHCIELTQANYEKVLNELRNDIVIFTGSFYFYPIVDNWMSRF